MEYNRRLSDFTAKSHELKRSMPSEDSQRLLDSVSNFEKTFSGIELGKMICVSILGCNTN